MKLKRVVIFVLAVVVALAASCDTPANTNNSLTSERSFKMIIGEPQHLCLPPFQFDLEDWEKDFLEYSQEGFLTTLDTEGKLRAIIIGNALYCYAKEAEIAGGVPLELLLGISWSETKLNSDTVVYIPDYSVMIDGKKSERQPYLFGPSGMSKSAFEYNKHKQSASIRISRHNLYAANNYLVRMGLAKNLSSEEDFIISYTSPPVWNTDPDKAAEVYRAYTEIKKARELFRK